MSPETAAWTLEQAQLSYPAEERILAELSELMPSDLRKALLSDLRRLFGNAVDMAFTEIKLREEAKERSKIRGEPSRPPVKLGVKLQARIGDFITSLEVASSRQQLHDVCDQIAQEPVLGDLVTMFLETQLRGRTTDPLVAAPDKIVDQLPCLLRKIERSISAATTSGKSGAALNYIARTFVAYFYKVTGNLPKRRTDPYNNGRETGPALEVCRILAEELHRVLPVDHRPTKPADMSTPFRKAVE